MLRVVLTEGNYLLLEDSPWCDARRYFDLTVFIEVDMTELERRLMQRWRDLGLPPAEVARKARDNDLVNARLVVERSAEADLVFTP